ncbi:Lrp/AsnC family transcriptional regulator [Nocardia sp. GAS34]|uniref:Lrp/AsnC family transcriptional regulator n=1 Tax=unclassified Nocardia TaxID=2637762 RepID=UPI003D1EF96D
MTANRPPLRAVDEVDVTLLDALHANPRVSFEKLGPILGISAATAARRWQRLVESGRAWVSSVPGPSLALVGAVFEVRAAPGHILEVAQELSAVPQAVSVYATSGSSDLTVIVIAADMSTLSSLLLQRLPNVAGIASATSHIGIEWYSGVHWRLGAIDTSQTRSVTAESDSEGRATPRVRTFVPADRQLFLALQRDGRARYRDLARELGSSEYLVRRQLDTLVRRGMLGFRTDFTRVEVGWPVEFVLWLSVPHHRLEEIGGEIASWPVTRICLSTTGVANLMVMAQVHKVGAIADALERVRTNLPDAEVVEHRLVLRPIKSWGRLLDADGRAAGLIPVDPWATADSGGK